VTKRDLFVVVADLDAENAIKALLCRRRRSLRIELDFRPEPPPRGDLLRWQGRDAGCRKDAADLLDAPRRTHRHALVLFDRHGCGAEDQAREEIEQEIEARLTGRGWSDQRARAIVIDPELEAWVWSDSPEVARLLGWGENPRRLRALLDEEGLWQGGSRKPSDPKRAMELALRKQRRPRSARLFGELASGVGLGRCQDPAFGKLKTVLRQWFGTGG
jgi:hypothetical protein